MRDSETTETCQTEGCENDADCPTDPGFHPGICCSCDDEGELMIASDDLDDD